MSINPLIFSDDLSIKIFSHLTLDEILRYYRVSRKWRAYLSQPSLWQEITTTVKSDNEIVGRICTFLDKIQLGQNARLKCFVRSNITSKYQSIIVTIKGSQNPISSLKGYHMRVKAHRLQDAGSQLIEESREMERHMPNLSDLDKVNFNKRLRLFATIGRCLHNLAYRYDYEGRQLLKHRRALSAENTQLPAENHGLHAEDYIKRFDFEDTLVITHKIGDGSVIAQSRSTTSLIQRCDENATHHIRDNITPHPYGPFQSTLKFSRQLTKARGAAIECIQTVLIKKLSEFASDAKLRRASL